MNKFISGLAEFSVYFSLIYSVLYFIGFARRSKAYKIFTTYIISISLISLSFFLIGRGWLNKPNLYITHIYLLFQFTLLSLFYSELLKKKWIRFIIPVGLAILVIQYLLNPAIINQYNSIGFVITQSLIVVYSIIMFYQGLTEKKEFIIVNIGVFFYLLSSTLYFASGNLVFNLNISKDTIYILIRLNTVLYFIFQLLILFEWWRNYRLKVKAN